jgi:hypothetical protein
VKIKNTLKQYYIEGEETLKHKKSFLKNIYLTQKEAQKLMDLATDYICGIPVRVVFGKRKTKHVFASCDLHFKDPRVIIYPGYNSVHIILHEAAHAIDDNEDHSEMWQKLFNKLIRKWNNKWSKEFNAR